MRQYHGRMQSFFGIALFEMVIDFFPCSHHGWLQGRKIQVLTH